MSQQQELVNLRTENTRLLQQLQAAAVALTTQELDIQRKELVFEIYDRLVSDAGEVIAAAETAVDKFIVGAKDAPAAIGKLKERLDRFNQVDTATFSEDLGKVEKILPRNNPTPGPGD